MVWGGGAGLGVLVGRGAGIRGRAGLVLCVGTRRIARLGRGRGVGGSLLGILRRTAPEHERRGAAEDLDRLSARELEVNQGKAHGQGPFPTAVLGISGPILKRHGSLNDWLQATARDGARSYDSP